MGNDKGMRERFGNVTELRSGRWQARYKRGGKALTAKTEDGLLPLTFRKEAEARRWLDNHAERIRRGDWPPAPEVKVETLDAYVETWLASRNLADRTRDHYRQLLRAHILPMFGREALPAIMPKDVRAWYGKLATQTGPTARAHAYGLLKSILATAMDDDLITANPCRVPSGGQAPTVKRMRPATLDELVTLTQAMPERLRMMVQLAVWCSLRFGELAELRRSDVDLKARLLYVRRAVVRTEAGTKVKRPKSEAGVRSVTIPPHVVDSLRDHLIEHVEPAKDALLFPAGNGGHIAPATLYRHFYAAREAAGRPDLRFHDLRHTGQTLAARAGADLRELMNRAGQSTSTAALRYIHEVDGRQVEIAEGLSALSRT